MVLELPMLSVDADTDDTLCEGAASVVMAVRPAWHKEDLQFKVYTDGITNKLVGVWSRTGDRDDQLLVRVYGKKTEMFIDRDAERLNMLLLHPHDCGPELHCSFSNGVCYAFTPGVTLTSATVREDGVYCATALRMALLHAIEVKEDHPTPMLFSKFHQFLDLLPEFDTLDIFNRAVGQGYTKPYLMAEMAVVREAVGALQCPIVLCHNDVLLGNVIWHEGSQTAHFIDLEYAAPNYQAFDVANHFCEFAGVETVDYDLYPSEEFQKKWITKYLSFLPPTTHRLSIRWWLSAVAVMSLSSHLFWGTWAMLQAQISTIDFDFLGYGISRLEEYRRRKQAFLALGALAHRDT